MKKKWFWAVLVCAVLFIAIILLVYFIFQKDETVYHWEFDYRVENIQEIKIIEIVNGDNIETAKTLKEIDLSLADNLCSDIKSLDMHKYGGNLQMQFGKSIMIVFDDGNYDVISLKEPRHYRYDAKYDKIIGINSRLSCNNDNSFNYLIDFYLSE